MDNIDKIIYKFDEILSNYILHGLLYDFKYDSEYPESPIINFKILFENPIYLNFLIESILTVFDLSCLQ